MCRNPKSRSREGTVLAETGEDSVTGVVAIPAVIFLPRSNEKSYIAYHVIYFLLR